MDWSLENLLKEEECEWLDFKREWPDNNANLIHDILSMLNSRADKSERYIIMGIGDNKEVVDVEESDKNREKKISKTEQEINDLIQNSNFNNTPQITVKREKYEGKNIDIIYIIPKNRPYYLTKQYSFTNKDKNGKTNKDENGKTRTVAAGAIYTRVGSTNTPIDKTANESEIIDLWRKRFGLDLSVLDRLKLYLKDYTHWGKTWSAESIWYYKEFPEFTVEIVDDDSEPLEFPEEWEKDFPGIEVRHNKIMLKYHTTTLITKGVSILDGGRYHIVDPERILINKDEKGKVIADGGYDKNITVRFYYKLRDSIGYYLDYILNSKESIGMFYRYKECKRYNKKVYIFDDKQEAEEKFKEMYREKNNI